MEEQQPWHRLFGLSLIDYFRETSVTVELEKDLSIKKQLLDVVVVYKDNAPLENRLPDGFEELANYNLISFKSHQEKLSVWSLHELIGHYVNLRKQVSPSMDEPKLLPLEAFRLFAVSVRFPRQMANDVTLESVKPGVYDISDFGVSIRLIVVNELGLEEQNAMLHLFSTRAELLNYGTTHYRIRSPETSTLLLDLFDRLKQEIEVMPDALEEFTSQYIDKLLRKLPPKKLLECLTPEDRLEGLSPEDRLEGLSPEKRLEGLSPEKRLEGLSPEQLLKGLSLEQRETILQLLTQQRG